MKKTVLFSYMIQKPKKVECDCNIKINMNYFSNDTNIGELLSKIENEKSSSNLKVTQCLNDVIQPEQIKSNSGFFLLLCILVIFIIVFIIFYIKGKNLLEAKIDEIIYNKFNKKNKNENKNNNNIIKENNKSKILHQSNKNYKRNHRKKLNNKKKLNSTKYNTQNEFISIEQNNKNILNLKNREEYIYNIKVKKRKRKIQRKKKMII